MHVIKMGTYGVTGAFTLRAVIVGALLGPIMIAGSYLGKRLVDRIPRPAFVAIVELVLAIFGLLFLIRG
jgi:uncharacterized membrane protein YfcA